MTAFDPFSRRRDRLIRNGLSDHFVRCVRRRHATMDIVSLKGRRHPLRPEQQSYISKRMALYRHCLTAVADIPDAGDGTVARVIWNHRLPFEFHEYIEAFWQSSAGRDRRYFQGLILAAGYYVHRAYDRMAAAEKLAHRARHLLMENRDNGWLGTTVDPVIAALGSTSPMPRI